MRTRIAQSRLLAGLETRASDTAAPFLLFGALLEKDLAKDVFLLSERFVVLDVVLVRLIKHAV